MCMVEAQVTVFSEGFEGNSIPVGWTTLDADDDGRNWTYFSHSTDRTAHTGTGACYSASYDGVTSFIPDNWLITPAISLNAAGTLKYWVCTQDPSYPNEHYGVYISTTSATDTSAFTLLFEETLTISEATWTERTVSLQNYTGMVYIAFRHYNCYGRYEIKLDDIAILAETNDPLIVPNISSLDFGQVLIYDTSEVQQITVNGYNLTSAITATVAAPFEISTNNIHFSHSETLADTGGILYVRYLPTELGNDNATLTLNSGSATGNISFSGISFHCDNMVLPLVESFEEATIPTCWSAISASTANQIGFVSTYASEGNYSLRFSSMNQASDYNQYLITPELPTDVGKILKFDYRTYYDVEVFSVGYSTTTNEIESFVWGEDVSSISYSSWMNYFNPTIPAEAKYIAIHYKSHHKYYLYIDNFEVSEIPSCMYPLNLTTNNITGHTIGVSWTTVNEDSEIFYVEYKNAADETAEWQQINTDENSIILTNLDPMTAYDIRIYADCGGSTSDTATLTASTVEACRMPLDITVSQITGTSALISWTPDHTYDGNQAFILEYTPEGGAAQTITVYGNQQLLANLDQQTDYNVLLYMDCGEDGLSDTLSTSFSTSCIMGGELAIGDGTTESNLLPTFCSYRYSYSQQIFLASEMNGEGNIRSISIESDTLALNRVIRMYLMHTNATSSATWLNASGAQLVYSGPITPGSGWITFNLTSPFAYNGTDNLALIVIDTTRTFNNGNNWITHTAFANCSNVSFSDNTPFSIATPPTNANQYMMSARNNVKFGVDCDPTATCAAPNVVVDNIGVNDITIVWAPGYTETSWEVEYKAASDTEWVSEGTVSVWTHTIANLQPNTEYNVRVGANCGTEILWSSVNARTECMTYPVPFSEDFDAYVASSSVIPFCWEKEEASVVHVSSDFSLSGNNALYIESSQTSSSTISLPEFDETVLMNSLIISFDIYANYYAGNVKVGIMTDPSDPATFVTIGSYTITESDQWESVEFNTRNYTGTGRYIAFQAPASGSLLAYIDNVSVHPIPECLHVENIQAADITTNSATITWEAVGTEGTWEYLYGTNVHVEEDQPIQVYDTEALLTGLAPNTQYDVYVRAVCPDDHSAWMYYSFRTSCEALTSLPFSEDFESYSSGSIYENSLPSCWSRINTGESAVGCPTVFYYPSYASSGSMVLYFNSSPEATYSDQYAILPEINTAALDVSALRLTFNVSRPHSTWISYSDFLIVGVMTDNTDTSTFVAVDTVYQFSTTPTRFFVDFADYTGSGGYIAFKNPVPSSSYNSSNLYIDDVSLDLAPACDNPELLTATVFSSTEVQITWGSESTEDTWQMLVVRADSTVDLEQAEIVNTNNHILSDLTENTAYVVYVRTVCSNGEGYSEWVSTTFITQSGTLAQVPYEYGFEDAEENAEWKFLNNATGNKWYIGMPAGATNNVLYVSGDSGVTTAYNFGDPCQVWAYRDIRMSTSAEIEVKFKWSCAGEANRDYMYAFFGNPNTVAASTSYIITPPANTEQLGGENYEFNGSSTSTWFSQTFNTSSMSGGVVKRLYFAWRNDGSSGVPPAIQIDSVIVRALTCGRPYNLTADHVLPYSAEVSFTPILSTDAAWEYVITEGTNPDDPTLTPISISSTLIPLSGLTPETTYHVFVRTHCGGGDYSQWSDPVTFTTPIACMAPSNITATAVTTTGATISWTEEGTATAWTLEYGVTGFTPGTGTVVNVSGTPSHNITGLTIATSYDVYVTANCSATENSQTILFTFDTECGAVVEFPYTENFDSSSWGDLPICWSTVSVVGYNSWRASVPMGSVTDHTHSGLYSAVFYPNGINESSDLIMPTLDLSNVSSPYISFWFVNEAWAGSNVDELTIYYRASATADWTELISYTAEHDTWTFDSLALPNPSATYQIKFNATSHYGSGIGIDDITVASANNTPVVTCNTPTNLAVFNISQTGATATWTAGGDESVWNLQYKQASASDWGSSINVTSTNYAITDLTANTAYQVRVQAVCDGATSDWTAVVNFTTLEEEIPDGISSYDIEKSVSLYPNPTASNVTISAQGMMESVSMYDVYGKLISTIKVEGTTTTVDLSSYASGVYFARITTENGVVTKRVVKK